MSNEPDVRNSSSSPDIVIRDGRPVAVILSLVTYRELLKKAEDLEALRRLDDFLAKFTQPAASQDADLADRPD